MKKQTIKKETYTYVLRTCNEDMSSKRDPRFFWPKKGKVSVKDWNPSAVCGQGLHGFAKGVGDSGLLDWSENAKGLVVKVKTSDIVELSGKVKFPGGEVVFCGTRDEAISYIADLYPDAPVMGAKRIAGDLGTATAGYSGTATAGYSGTATAGYAGTATAGKKGTATAGDLGTATAGDSGTATAGDSGTATAGEKGTATAGEKGIIQIFWYDCKSSRTRIVTGYVGENGILPNVAYKLDENTHEFVKA